MNSKKNVKIVENQLTIKVINVKKLKKFICKIKEFISGYGKCPSCGKGTIRHFEEEYNGRYWLNVYECDTCKEKFI